jgi:hypothetical protein
MIGLVEVKSMESAGWEFQDAGVRLADCWAVWACKGENYKFILLADPDHYPELWIEVRNVTEPQLELQF